MKAVVVPIIAIMWSCSMITAVHAQKYFRGELTVIQPSQVMIENYTAIKLVKGIEAEPKANLFDKYNPYTYLQLINDDVGGNYHILYQAMFSGKLLFLAYSNNLSVLFNTANKPMNVFMNCMKQVNDYLSPIQNAEAAVQCIINRLNYCSN